MQKYFVCTEKKPLQINGSFKSGLQSYKLEISTDSLLLDRLTEVDNNQMELKNNQYIL